MEGWLGSNEVASSSNALVGKTVVDIVYGAWNDDGSVAVTCFSVFTFATPSISEMCSTSLDLLSEQNKNKNFCSSLVTMYVCVSRGRFAGKKNYRGSNSWPLSGVWLGDATKTFHYGTAFHDRVPEMLGRLKFGTNWRRLNEDSWDAISK